jgi:hypothetical protein
MTGSWFSLEAIITILIIAGTVYLFVARAVEEDGRERTQTPQQGAPGPPQQHEVLLLPLDGLDAVCAESLEGICVRMSFSVLLQRSMSDKRLGISQSLL